MILSRDCRLDAKSGESIVVTTNKAIKRRDEVHVDESSKRSKFIAVYLVGSV